MSLTREALGHSCSPQDPFSSPSLRSPFSALLILCRKADGKNVSLGVYGRHSNDAKSINFFDEIGLDYVSSPPPSLYPLPVPSSSYLDLLLPDLGPLCRAGCCPSPHPVQEEIKCFRTSQVASSWLPRSIRAIRPSRLVI
jgi:hypothetical protein